MSAGSPRLGTVVGVGRDAHWSVTGRPLTDWEHRMRAKATDIWMPIGTAVHRLAMPFAQMVEFERSFDIGIGQLFGRLPAEGPAPAGRSSPLAEASGVLRLALIGGGIAVRNGEQFPVTPGMAVEIVDRLTDGPLDHVWRLARAIAEVVQAGRPASSDEMAAFTIPAGPPIIPAWALEYRA